MKRRDLLRLLAAAPVLWIARRLPAAERSAADVERMRADWRRFLPADFDPPKPDERVSHTPAEWRQRLGERAFEVLREAATEPASSSPLNDEKRPGVFVCAGCDLPLFTSEMKYDSGTGWPSFFTTIPDVFETQRDWALVVPRTEYHCVRCGGHHGHVFDDGPPPTKQRWCNNGVALRFLAAGDAPESAESSGPDAPRAVATFAGGCFWCMEPPFDALEGVLSTTAGYTGGSLADPSYEQVSSGGTGHAEAVRVTYDPRVVDYAKLLDVFWHNVDPTDAKGQFCDRGSQYRSAIFVHDDVQRERALQSKRALERTAKLPGPIATEIVAAGDFYPAEDDHQDYARKNPLRYRFYRRGCGRDARLEEIWAHSR